MRTASALLLALALALPGSAADKPPAGKLELPAPQVVEYRPGKLLRIEAKGAAKVAWEVLTVPPVELDFAEKGTALLLPMPPPGTSVWIFAAATAAGDIPSIAKTSVTVKGQVQAPAPQRPKVGRVKYVTLLFPSEAAKKANAMASSPTLKAELLKRGVSLAAATWKEAENAGLGFEDQEDAKGNRPALIVQGEDGAILPEGVSLALPPSGPGAEAAVLAYVDAINAP